MVDDPGDTDLRDICIMHQVRMDLSVTIFAVTADPGRPRCHQCSDQSEPSIVGR